jgi:hypothetical protein
MIGVDASAKSETAAANEDFYSFVVKHFDANYYLQTYVDVASSGLSPLEHWLGHGFREGRQFSESILVRLGTSGKRSSDRNWRLFRWRETDIALRVLPPVPSKVVSQILNQARHDPAVLAAGLDAIKNLTLSDREDVHLNVAGLQHAIRPDPEFLLIVPRTNCEQDLVAALSNAGFGLVQSIITDQESADADGQADIAKGVQPSEPVFWRDFWIHDREDVKLYQLAQLIRVLRPRITIVAASRHGYEVVARYGRCLLEHTKLFCIYSTVDEGAFADYPGRTLPFAIALTDDDRLTAEWRERYRDVLLGGIATLPRHSPSSFLNTVVTLFKR